MNQEQLIQIDFQHIDNLDPCVEGGYHIIFDQELPFLIRFMEDSNEDKNTVEVIRVRVMVLGAGKELHQLTIELSSESDLFFYYFHTVDQGNFQNVKNQQHLNVEFSSYPDVCVKTFRRCQTEQQKITPVLTLLQNGQGRVSIMQTLEYKEMELISFDMLAGDDEIIRQHVTYKYGAIKSKYQISNAKIKDVNNQLLQFKINEIVKTKNPQLMLHLQKYMNF